MGLTILVAVVIGLLGFSAFGEDEPDLGWFLVVLSVFMLSTVAYFRHEERMARHFVQWIWQNRYVILSNGARWHNHWVRGDTEVTRYVATMSFLVVTQKAPSGFFVVGRASELAPAAYTLVSLLFGWWGIPWGPIWTLQTLSKNTTGGYRQRVDTMIAAMDPSLGSTRRTAA